MTISQTEVSKILDKLNQTGKAMFSSYQLAGIINLGYDESVSTIDYMVRNGFLEKIIHNDNEFYILTKKGIKFIEESKNFGKEKARESDKVGRPKGRRVIENRVIDVMKFVKKHERVLIKQVQKGVEITYNQAYEALTLLETRGKLSSTMEGQARCFFIPSNEELVKKEAETPLIQEPTPEIEQPPESMDNLLELSTDLKIQTIIKILMALPGNEWITFECKRNQGSPNGFLKIKISGIDNSIDFYQNIKGDLPFRPKLELNNKNDFGTLNIKLTAEETG